jgi:hypothetical protein
MRIRSMVVASIAIVSLLTNSATMALMLVIGRHSRHSAREANPAVVLRRASHEQSE